VARQLAAPIFIYAVTSKHPAYAHEKETRLVIMNDLERLAPMTDLRTRGSSLVPYIPSPFRVRAPGALTSIIIGPAADRLSDDAVRTFLRTQRLSTEIVQQSGIPYTAR
jgi:hypothetical protein